MTRGPIRALLRCALVAASMALPIATVEAMEPSAETAASASADSQTRRQAIASLPLARLTPAASQRILSIAESPTIYRRLPAQAIPCDRDLFVFLARNPEILVGMWDLMGITKVQTQRVGPYELTAQDGSGTTCRVDLVYGDANLHVFVADGYYDGPLVGKPIHGRGVFVLRSSYAESSSGGTTVTGTLDCFVQFDNLGADLVARTLSGLIGRSADNNFEETARFVAQVSQASQHNTPAMIDVASRLPQVASPTKQEFADLITRIARRAGGRWQTTAEHQQTQVPLLGVQKPR